MNRNAYNIHQRLYAKDQHRRLEDQAILVRGGANDRMIAPAFEGN